MAGFDLNGLKCVHQASGFGLFVYKSTTDAIATCIASGYFNSVDEQLGVGSAIYIKATDAVRMVVVDTNSGGVVTVADSITSAVANLGITDAKLAADVKVGSIAELAGITSEADDVTGAINMIVAAIGAIPVAKVAASAERHAILVEIAARLSNVETNITELFRRAGL